MEVITQHITAIKNVLGRFKSENAITIFREIENYQNAIMDDINYIKKHKKVRKIDKKG